uniref:hypothetical protein n=1 Tax=Tumebacillus lacus TaxID=2995335 RepID=UPI00389B2C3A
MSVCTPGIARTCSGSSYCTAPSRSVVKNRTAADGAATGWRGTCSSEEPIDRCRASSRRSNPVVARTSSGM